MSPDQSILRFLEKTIPEPNSGCWLWVGAQGRSGYGTFKVSTVVTARAHRWSYQSFIGEIPAGSVVCHRCDNPSCVNPQHLVVGSQAYNLRDARLKGRFPTGDKYTNFNKQKIQCKYGHLFNASNTYLKPNGQRMCRICGRNRLAQYRQRKGSINVAE